VERIEGALIIGKSLIALADKVINSSVL